VDVLCRTGKRNSLYRSTFPYILLLLDWRISFVIAGSLLNRGSLYKGSTVPWSKGGNSSEFWLPPPPQMVQAHCLLWLNILVKLLQESSSPSLFTSSPHPKYRRLSTLSWHCLILCDTPEDVHLSHLGVIAEKDNIDVDHFKGTQHRGGNRTFPIWVVFNVYCNLLLST